MTESEFDPSAGGRPQGCPPPPPGYYAGQPPCPPPPQPAQPPVPSALSMAWADVRASRGWFGKAALLALVMMVPVLNFFAVGYLLLWGCDAARGRREALPQGTFRDGSFALGFYVFAVSLIAGLVVGLVVLVPFLGLLALVAMAFLYPLLYAAYLRIGLTGCFGAAFDLSEIWARFRAGMGQAMLSWWGPSLICSAAISVLAVPITLLALVPMFAAAGFAGAGSELAVPAVLLGLGAFFLIGALVAYAILLLSACTQMVVFRAFGHWVARFAPHWAAPAAGPGEGGRQ